MFAAGDVVTAAGSVISAIASGRETAVAVDLFLGFDGVIPEELSSTVETSESWAGTGDATFALKRRVTSDYVPAEERVACFKAVENSLDSDSAKNESLRCLRCDQRFWITPVKFWGEYD